LTGTQEAKRGMAISGTGFISDYDVYLLRQGNHSRLYHKLGSHPVTFDGENGTHFAVWAPNARFVSVIGDFNGWNRTAHRLSPRPDGSGIWEGFIPGVGHGDLYKYHILSQFNGYSADKGDPFAAFWEQPPRTASIIWELDYEWQDTRWMSRRHDTNSLHAPVSVYEVHLGSWARVPEEHQRPLTYRELCGALTEYVLAMEFTHVEFLPVMEHPFSGSWGYQTVGYFAPTSRFGTPQEFMGLIDTLHRNNIGVILDWVPSHFPVDGYGLSFFDGTHLYEHSHPDRGFHPEWTSCIFNYGRNEVQAFLISSALSWFERYHADGLRVDGVASMLYLDYARAPGKWIPNRFGGNENLEAIHFLRKLNEAAYGQYPDIQVIAEESTAWPMVTRPTYAGGLGFGLKWNLGWMHDILDYLAHEPVHRKYHHNELLFSLCYAFSENFLLPLSHDEVVHGKGSLIGKMPGDDWQRRANLRLLLGYQYCHPGKKLLFMGGEFGQEREWDHNGSLDWHLRNDPGHEGLLRWTRDLNRVYRHEPALHQRDTDYSGFAWVDIGDWEGSIISFLRSGNEGTLPVLAVCNFTPVPRYGYRIGVPTEGFWRELLNSDAAEYGGSGTGNLGGLHAEDIPWHGRPFSLSLTVPPLSISLFLPEER